MQRYPAHAPARAFRRALLAALIGLLLFSLLPHPASAQPDANASDPITITLAEAVDVALTQSYALKNSRLDVENAEARIREAWGSVLPSVDASASYTRNVRSANPFAGSDAGDRSHLEPTALLTQSTRERLRGPRGVGVRGNTSVPTEDRRPAIFSARGAIPTRRNGGLFGSLAIRHISLVLFDTPWR